MRFRKTSASLLALGALLSCGDTVVPVCTNPAGCPMGGNLRVHELMASNDGAWLDEAGETDDWLELRNESDAPIDLLGYSIADGPDALYFLPSQILGPGEVLLLWLDNDPEQGSNHLDFELSRDGETLQVFAPDGVVEDEVAFGPQETNITWARFDDAPDTFTTCLWSTPGRANGRRCEPPAAQELQNDYDFLPYDWAAPAPTAIALSEVSLRPNMGGVAFVELHNAGATSVESTDLQLELAAHEPGRAWPILATGAITLAFPTGTIAPGAFVQVTVSAPELADLEANDFEGVVTLRDISTNSVLDRIDFMAWPEGATLARRPALGTNLDHRFEFCATSSPGIPNDTCGPLASRPIGDRLRNIYTPGDFATLSEGGVAAGIASVKVVVDMLAGDAFNDVRHYLRAADWDLHYTFVREVIDGDPPLDRCDPAQESQFVFGWSQFSSEQYFSVETRRYLLGTLAHHLGPGVRTLEFATGDRITPDQMLRAFFSSTTGLDDPQQWFMRPQGSGQRSKMQMVDGQAPVVDTNTVFQDVELQLLTEGVGYGTLQFIPAAQLPASSVDNRTVVITDAVPNDIPLVGGLITQSLQTPLAHVNVLSRNRGTPNMAWVSALDDPDALSLLNSLVRLEVTPTGFTIAAADASEAQAFWDAQIGGGPLLTPSLNTGLRGVQDLSTHGLESIASLGAKAAQLGELGRVNSIRASCPGPLDLPQNPAALPVVHSLEHYAASGATELLSQLEQESQFLDNPQYRAERLADVRDLVLGHPVEPALLSEVESYVQLSYGFERVRFRSSSNTEDLSEFSGAGLYESLSVEMGDPERTVADGLRRVWASLYFARAYDERRRANVDEAAVAMGILIHPAFISEEANGVAISRNIADPIRGDQYTFNSQFGEAGVVNPAAGVTSEQVIYRWGRSPRLVYQSLSSLPGSGTVLTSAESEQLACQTRAIHDHFRPLLDPTAEDSWFAMDTEFKLTAVDRRLVFKQARPYSFGDAARPVDCREF